MSSDPPFDVVCQTCGLRSPSRPSAPHDTAQDDVGATLAGEGTGPSTRSETLRDAGLVVLGLLAGLLMGQAPWAAPAVYIVLLLGFAAIAVVGGVHGGLGGWVGLIFAASVTFVVVFTVRSMPGADGSGVPRFVLADEWRASLIVAVGGGFAALTVGYWAGWWFGSARRARAATSTTGRGGSPTLATVLVIVSVIAVVDSLTLSPADVVLIRDGGQVVTVTVTDRQVSVSPSRVHPGAVYFAILELGERADGVFLAGQPWVEDEPQSPGDRAEVARVLSGQLPAVAPCAIMGIVAAMLRGTFCEWSSLAPPEREASDRYWGTLDVRSGDTYAWYAVTWPPHVESGAVITVE